MLKLLKRLNKKQVSLILISIVFIVGQVWLDLKLPDYMTEITTLLQTEGTRAKDILIPGGYMLLCALGSLLSAFIVGYFVSRVSSSFTRNLRGEIFRKVENFGMKEMNEFSTSSLITRTTNDITQVQTLISMGLQMIIKAPILAVWAICKISSKSWQWSLATGVAVFLLLIMVAVLIVLVLPKFSVVQKLIDNLNKITRENLTGLRVVRAFNAEKYQENRFEQANEKLTNTQLFIQRMMAILNPGMNFIMSSLTLSIYFIGAYLIDAANMMDRIDLFSNMVVFTSYAMQVIMSFVMLAMIFIIYPRANISAKRVNEVLEQKNFIKDGTFDGKTDKHGLVEFKNVYFKYPDAEEYMLENISFIAKPGETIAFIGSTGSGKSTLINLIPRFYDVTNGEILIDGINVKNYKLSSLYNKLGYISQKAVIFSGTIKSNVNYGENINKDLTDEKIKKAIEVAQGKEFVEQMDNTYDAHISQGGTNLSGGQKQRISIARAIARDPEIYIFDDSFSALDYKTDSVLRKELKKHTKNATVLIVAQRIGTIKNADRIIVLEEGKAVGIGTHKELLESCDVYREIALSQLSKEELENA